MRSRVESLAVIDASTHSTAIVEDVGTIDRGPLRDFLGTIPAILSAPRALAVEGNETSFDATFYPWLLGQEDLAIAAVEDKASVIAITKREGLWSRLTPGLSLAGVVDHDFGSPELPRACVELEYHEAESYLCEPGFVQKLGAALGIEPTPSTEELTKMIFEELNSCIAKIAATRAGNRAAIHVAVSVPGKFFQSAPTREAIAEAIRASCAAELAKATNALDEVALLRHLDEQFQACDQAIKDQNVDLALRLCPGKALAMKMARRIGCKGLESVVRGATAHLKIAEFPHLRRLQQKLRERLGVPPGQASPS
jgi:hypothetical protein